MVVGSGDQVRALGRCSSSFSTSWAAARSLIRGAGTWTMVGRAALGYTAGVLTMCAFEGARGLRATHCGGGIGRASIVSAAFLSPMRRSTRATNCRVSWKGGMPRWRITCCSPALYAARASGRSPLKVSSMARRWLAPASMFSSGSCGSRTPMMDAVAGMSCMRPRAPLWETAA